MVEKEKGRLLKFTEERNNEIMQYNNQLAALQTRLDKAQSEAVKWYVDICIEFRGFFFSIIFFFSSKYSQGE